MARFKVRPLREPRCHLQISPFSMSWMCCTMRLMATVETEITCEKSFHVGERPLRSAMFTEILTHVVNSSWNDYICILLSLMGEIQNILNEAQKKKKWEVTLTGRQNSSKAGLTNVVYCVRICSRSLPRLMSRRTTGTTRSYH